MENLNARAGTGDASILEDAGIGMLRLGPDRRILSANDLAARLLQQDGKELSGRPFEEAFPGAAHRMLARSMTEAREQGATIRVEPFPLRPGGLWLSCLCRPDRDGFTLILQDVTASRRAEQELEESREHYRTLYHGLRQGVCEFDEHGILVSANPAASGIAGVDLSRLAGIPSAAVRDSFPRVTREDGTPYRDDEDIVKLALETGRTIPDHLARLYNPGKNAFVWVLAYTVPWFRPGHDEPSGAFVIFSDITGLKDSQESLHRLNEELEHKVQARTEALTRTASMLEKQNELLQGIIDHIPVMIVLTDPEQRIWLVNREFERVSGWSLEDARRVDIMAATQPDPGERQRAIGALANAEPGWLDFLMHTRSGRVLSTSWATVRFSDDSTMSIGIDVSDRRNMEQDLLRLATAVQQSSEGVAVSSADGVIEYVNPAFEHITGYSRDELVGKPAGSFKEYFAGYSVQEIILRTTREGKTWNGRQQRRRKTGEAIEVDISVSPVRDRTGRITNFVSVMRDVTQETRLQKQLSLSQRMEAIGSLAGGIAHDLKNILTPILLNTEIALEDVGEASPTHPLLEEVLEAAKLGRDLVQQILTFSRRAPQKKTEVNVPAVIRETVSFLRSSLPATIEIREAVEDSCAVVFADPTQIKQVLINLGSNAGYAMRDKGGFLEVSETVVSLDEQDALRISPELKAGAYVQISVQDTGYGMDAGIMEHIFEPFFTTKKGEGTGMGLAVAHGIVREHQGAITVSSSPGHGTTFTVLIPVLGTAKEEGLDDRSGLAGTSRCPPGRSAP